MSEYRDIVEELMSHFTSGEYEAEALSAKKEFFRYAGIFDEESDHFEQKISQFSDWFLFTRPLMKSGKPPVLSVIENREIDIKDDQKEFYQNLVNNRHSLFEFNKVKDDDVHIKDLIHSEKIIVKDSEVTIGFEKGQIFEARLIPHKDSFAFARSFCFHPVEAEKFILKEVKRVKKLKGNEQDSEKEELIWRLFRMRHKHEQYGHVDVKQIYSNESKLNL